MYNNRYSNSDSYKQINKKHFFSMNQLSISMYRDTTEIKDSFFLYKSQENCTLNIVKN